MLRFFGSLNVPSLYNVPVTRTTEPAGTDYNCSNKHRPKLSIPLAEKQKERDDKMNKYRFRILNQYPADLRSIRLARYSQALS